MKPKCLVKEEKGLGNGGVCNEKFTKEMLFLDYKLNKKENIILSLALN